MWVFCIQGRVDGERKKELGEIDLCVLIGNLSNHAGRVWLHSYLVISGLDRLLSAKLSVSLITQYLAMSY